MSAAVSFAATGKLPVRSGRNGARSLVLLNRVYTVLTQARTGPPRRSESNESMEQQSLRRAWQTGLAQYVVLAFSGHSNRGRSLNSVRVTKAASLKDAL